MIAQIPYRSLAGIGAVSTDSGASIPDHYLVPMSRLAIDLYIGRHTAMWKDSPFYAECPGDWDGETQPCTLALLEIERANLYFVNKLITYDQLVRVYNQAADAIANIPRLPTLKEQLRDAGKFLVGTVTGFFTAGPVGIFTGGAAAVNQILEQEKARRAVKIQALLDPALDAAAQADALRVREQNTKTLKRVALWGGGAAAFGGLVWWMLSD